MRNASGHDYCNNSFIMDVATGYGVDTTFHRTHFYFLVKHMISFCDMFKIVSLFL